MIQKMTGILLKKTSDKEAALKAMISRAMADQTEDHRKTALAACLEREITATTVVETGLALPHAILSVPIPPVLAVGFSHEGIIWDSSGEAVNIILLLICHEKDHLTSLAETASLIQVPGTRTKLSQSRSADEIIDILESARNFHEKKIPHEKERLTQDLTSRIGILLKSSVGSRALLFINNPEKAVRFMKELPAHSLSLVTNREEFRRELSPAGDSCPVFTVKGDLRDEKHILRELWTRGDLKEGEIIISISGFEHDDMPHSLSLTAIPWDLYNRSRIMAYNIPHNVNKDILNQIIFLALELSSQGREGKPVGTIFVLGDYQAMEPFCKQLIVNPFGGLDRDNRNILDSSLTETIKEFSKIDGAFIIENDGQIHSAGTYLSIPPDRNELPSGLGARHAAARGITLAAPVVSVVISESTGTIRVFWDGSEQDKYS